MERMTNEEKSQEIVTKHWKWLADFLERNNLSKEDRNQIRFKTYEQCLEMAEWKDEELKKYILELEAKADVWKSSLRDAKNEIKLLKNKIEELCKK